MKIILISDPEILGVPIRDNQEPMVNISEKDFILDRRKKLPESYYRARKSVVTRLLEVQKELPDDVRLALVESFRPLYLQERYFKNYSAKLKNAHPDWDEKRIYLETSKYVSPPDIIPPHSTGGAVDLTLYKSGREFDMGTTVNANPEETKNACFTFAENISEVARRNRRILIDSMTTAGFVNYPTEWWHWSYGDRYWAYQTKSQFAIYGTVNDVDAVKLR